MGESGAEGGASLMFFSVVCLSKTIGLVLDFLLGNNMHIYIYGLCRQDNACYSSKDRSWQNSITAIHK